MREAILCKCGEIVLKGANRFTFENTLIREIKRRAKKCGKFRVNFSQSTIYVEPEDEDADVEKAYYEIKKVFGLAGITRSAVCEKDIEVIKKTVCEYLAPVISKTKTFRCEAKRSDKTFQYKSPEICAIVGEAVLEKYPEIKVDLHDPELAIWIEVREGYAFIHAGQEKAAGGLPYATGGKGLLLLSGGIDSPVAGYMMAKRGMAIEAVYYESIPYTSELARDKVLKLASTVSSYCNGYMRVKIISLTKIQEQIRDNCDEEYFTLVLRRYMMKIASRIADADECRFLITGESLGQVASQTAEALCVTEDSAGLPVMRPCIGLDKEEIIARARDIGTYDTSVLPYEDCCTVFTPRHPKTKPVLEKVMDQENKTDMERLIEEALASEITIPVNDRDI